MTSLFGALTQLSLFFSLLVLLLPSPYFCGRPPPSWSMQPPAHQRPGRDCDGFASSCVCVRRKRIFFCDCEPGWERRRGGEACAHRAFAERRAAVLPSTKLSGATLIFRGKVRGR
ncbi:none [Leptomonas seymouri]|uniref:None n=1 Tax=Leptomonas seymouri TaxID=5684 RepID=A0A0N0P536_LEPSE|nr:none [Leptomonas seymouri]|eukprot:KPI86006.1 none [Leptomonas seymouri]